MTKFPIPKKLYDCLDKKGKTVVDNFRNNQIGYWSIDNHLQPHSGYSYKMEIIEVADEITEVIKFYKYLQRIKNLEAENQNLKLENCKLLKLKEAVKILKELDTEKE